MTHIKLQNISVRYPVYSTTRQRSILGFAANRASFGRIAQDVGKIPVVTAISDVTLTLEEGDRLALIGRNGSGKTSLLKVCAQLLVPDSGGASIQGSSAAILNLFAGMDSERSGLENIELVGRLLGVPRSARAALVEDVAQFTELGQFLDLPIRTYSSGMTVRLAFALATSVARDILVVDEVIGAGDALFVDRAAERMKALFNRTKILVLATHSGDIAQKLCNRAAWIDCGKLVMEGSPAEVWDAYLHQRLPEVSISDPAAEVIA